jgi:hypothetical protein
VDHGIFLAQLRRRLVIEDSYHSCTYCGKEKTARLSDETLSGPSDLEHAQHEAFVRTRMEVNASPTDALRNRQYRFAAGVAGSGVDAPSILRELTASDRLVQARLA